MNEIRVREMEDEEEDIRYGLTLCSVFVISSFIKKNILNFFD